MGGVANRFPKGDIDQNVYLDTKVENVGSNTSTFEHCTNVPHMEKLEHTFVMPEILPVLFYVAHTIPTRQTSI